MAAHLPSTNFLSHRGRAVREETAGKREAAMVERNRRIDRKERRIKAEEVLDGEERCSATAPANGEIAKLYVLTR